MSRNATLSRGALGSLCRLTGITLIGGEGSIGCLMKMNNESSSGSWSFVHACDLHLGSPKSYRYDPSRNANWATARAQMDAIGPDLLLVGGDVTRDGDTHEWEYQMVTDDFASLPFPVFVIPGNQDVGNKHTAIRGNYSPDRDDLKLNVPSERLSLFSSYFGPINWTFVHRNVRFTGFYDAVLGSGLPEEARLWSMLEKLNTLPPVKHHVVVMHYALLIDDLDEQEFDITNNEEYLPWYFSVGQAHRRRLLDLLKKAGVEIIFSGHIHMRRPVQNVEGICYFQGAAVGGRAQWEDKWPDGDPTIGFFRCDVTPENIAVTFVPVDPASQLESRGPQGHPLPQFRVYPEGEGQDDV